MAFNYLTPDNVVEVFKSSRQYTEGITDNFPEYERIARNKPHASIARELPKTTDGTTASIIRKTPHRVIQQLPTGVVKSDTHDWLSVIAQFVYTHKIIPAANEDYALLQKCWLVVERFLTYGFCPTYVPFLDHNGYFCPDLKLPYWGDIFLQPGKLSDSSSAYIFMRSWWHPQDVEALIDSQGKLSKGTERTWNVDALRRVKDFTTTKEEKAKSQFEKSVQNKPPEQVEFITAFQRGKGAKFYTFHVQSGEILRTKVNKDPRGEIPAPFAYGDIDGSNPFGRSVIDLVGGMQNLMDGEMQMYQFNRALMLAPPLIKKGNWDKNKAKLAPNIVIDLGSDTNASLDPLIIDNSSLQNFAQNYSLMKSQLINLLASPDTSISAEAGNPGFSKTPAGVQQLQANLSVDDNYVRKQFETWFERWSETVINMYFAERTGIEELQLDDETAEALRGMDDFDPNLLSPDNKVRINYDSATPALKFEVDASSSRMENPQAQQQIAKDLLELVMKFPMLNSAWGGPIDVDGLARKIVETSAIENPETIAPEPTKEQKMAKVQARQKPNGFSPMFDKPKLDIRYPDLPAAAQVQLLGLAGIQVSMEDVMQGPPADVNIDRNDAQGNTVTPDHILSADQQSHQQQMDQAKLALEATKVQNQDNQARAQLTQKSNSDILKALHQSKMNADNNQAKVAQAKSKPAKKTSTK